VNIYIMMTVRKSYFYDKIFALVEDTAILLSVARGRRGRRTASRGRRNGAPPATKIAI
jgi:hypothetical protein